MTYVALAKSLGFSLKNASSSSSTTTTATSTESCTGASCAVTNSKVTLRSQSVDWSSETTTKSESTSMETTSSPPYSPSKSIEVICPLDRESMRINMDSGVLSKTEIPEDTVGENKTEIDFQRDVEAISDIASSRSSSPITVSINSNNHPNGPSLTAKSNTAPALENKSKSSEESSNPKLDADIPISSSSQVPTNRIDDRITDEQLHQAKVLILDLLGWGVPPEYLVQRDSIIADCITLANATTKS